MPFSITCPTCRHQLTVIESRTVYVTTCPTCRHPLTVPAMAAATPVDSEPDAFVPNRRTRKQKSNAPLVLTAAVLVGVVGAGVWFGLARSRDGDSADAKKVAEPEPPPAPAVTPKPKPFIQPPKKAEPPKPLVIEPKLDPEPAKPLGLDDTWAELEKTVAIMRKEGEVVAEQKKRLFTDKEADLLQSELRYDLKKQYTPLGSPSMADDVSLLLAQSGLVKLAFALRCQYAMKDTEFYKVAKLVWNRSPKVQTLDGLGGLAARWGRIDPVERNNIFVGLKAVESGDKDMAEFYRNVVIGFAGEDYYVNRP